MALAFAFICIVGTGILRTAGYQGHEDMNYHYDRRRLFVLVRVAALADSQLFLVSYFLFRQLYTLVVSSQVDFFFFLRT